MLITVILAAVGGVISFVFPCVAPFGALAASAALRGRMRSTLVVVSAAWAVNEAAGFTLFQYPRTPDSVTWAALSVCAALSATVLTSWAMKVISTQSPWLRGAAALAISTIGFELTLAAGALAAGRSMEGFRLDVDLLVIETNLVFFLTFEAAALLARTMAARYRASRT